ncbi:hypothetical protein HK405_003210, partial [Cladochytrium tenue]
MSVDFIAKMLHCVTILTLRISPDRAVDEISLHCEQLVVERVLVNDCEAEFTVNSPILPPEACDPTHHPELRTNYLWEMTSDTGQLVVKLPSAILTYPVLFTDNHAMSSRFWLPCIDSLSECCSWEIHFRIPRTAQDAGWLPGRDSDRKAIDEQVGIDEDDDGDEDALDELDFEDEKEALDIPEMSVVCVGELLEHSVIPDSPSEKHILFRSEKSLPSAHVQFTIGPFMVHELPLKPAGQERAAGDAEVDDGADGGHERKISRCLAFYLPGYESDVQETVKYIPKAFAFMEKYIGVGFPFQSMALVFLEELNAPVIYGAGLCILSAELLYGEDIIDQVYLTQRYVAGCIAAQWFGQMLIQKKCLRTKLSAKDMNRLFSLDIHQPPLCPDPDGAAAAIRSSLRPKPGDKRTTASLAAVATATRASIEAAQMDPVWLHRFNPYDEWASLRAGFIALKAPLVLHMLDRRMGRGCMQKVIRKVLDSSYSLVSTQTWVKHCKKISGKMELRHFADQWLYGSGCPQFEFRFRFNRKKLMVEVFIRQTNSNAGNPGATEKFTGPFLVRVHEPKGTTYDTQLNIEDVERQYDIQYHTKYKRSGQKLKKLKRMGINTGAGGEDVNDDAEIDEREELAVAERGPDLDQFDRRSLDWIRWDPDNDWVCLKACEQLQSMWIDQLSRDVDVSAQYEALTALTGNSEITTAALSRVLHDERYFYRLRMEAVFSLVKGALEGSNNEGITKVLEFYMEHFCFPKAEGSSIVIPRPNNFSSFQDYYIQKRFILNLLKFNDNTHNEYSDCYFVCTLINAVCNSFLPQAGKGFSVDEKLHGRAGASVLQDLVEELDVNEGAYDEDPEEINKQAIFGSDENKALFEEARSEIERYLSLDPLLASHQNMITVSCLTTLAKWSVAGLMHLELDFLLSFTQPGNFVYVRQRAFDSVIILDGFRRPKIIHYLFDVVRNDPHPRIRFHVAKSLAEYAIIASGDVLRAQGQHDERDAEAAGGGAKDKAGLDAAAAAALSDELLTRRQMEWRQLRKRLQADTSLGADLWGLMGQARDFKIRAYLLKLAETLYDAYQPPPPPPPELPAELALATVALDALSMDVDVGISGVETYPAQPLELPPPADVGLAHAVAPAKPKLVLKITPSLAAPAPPPAAAPNGTAHRDETAPAAAAAPPEPPPILTSPNAMSVDALPPALAPPPGPPATVREPIPPLPGPVPRLKRETPESPARFMPEPDGLAPFAPSAVLSASAAPMAPLPLPPAPLAMSTTLTATTHRADGRSASPDKTVAHLASSGGAPPTHAPGEEPGPVLLDRATPLGGTAAAVCGAREHPTAAQAPDEPPRKLRKIILRPKHATARNSPEVAAAVVDEKPPAPAPAPLPQNGAPMQHQLQSAQAAEVATPLAIKPDPGEEPRAAAGSDIYAVLEGLLQKFKTHPSTTTLLHSAARDGGAGAGSPSVIAPTPAADTRRRPADLLAAVERRLLGRRRGYARDPAATFVTDMARILAECARAATVTSLSAAARAWEQDFAAAVATDLGAAWSARLDDGIRAHQAASRSAGTPAPTTAAAAAAHAAAEAAAAAAAAAVETKVKLETAVDPKVKRENGPAVVTPATAAVPVRATQDGAATATVGGSGGAGMSAAELQKCRDVVAKMFAQERSGWFHYP